MKRSFRKSVVLTITALLLLLSIGGCSPDKPKSYQPTGKTAAGPLPDTAYYGKTNLVKWIDPESGYDTTRKWKLNDSTWPILLIMSPSQAPQLLMGMKHGIYQEAFKPFGISLTVEKLDGPERTFHALERSKWPIIYGPAAVYTDYIRSAKNQGNAGGLQYVAIAGSTAGGGYYLMAKSNINSISDLKGKTIGITSSSPVQYALLKALARKQGVTIGNGPNDVRVSFGNNGDTASQFNKYQKGEYDAIIGWGIFKKQLSDLGSHVITDFTDTDIKPNYTILAVEREVLEKRPDVIDALLAAHYKANKLAVQNWESETLPTLFHSWNDFFTAQKTPWSKQRIVPSVQAYKAMLGNMWPESILDRTFFNDCFAANDETNRWGWGGTVDTSKLINYEIYNRVLKANGEKLQ